MPAGAGSRPITPIIRPYLAPLPLDWTSSHTLPRLGWEWAILGLRIPTTCRKAATPGAAPRPTVLVAMGGSDPHGLTLRMAKALAVLDCAFRIHFVIGTGMKDARRPAA